MYNNEKGDIKLVTFNNYRTLLDNELHLILGGNSQNISRNLIALRKQNNYSRCEIADKLNVSVSTIARYEEGNRIPDIDMIINMCKLFDVKIDKLVNYNNH